MRLLPEPREIMPGEESFYLDYRGRIVLGDMCGENGLLYAGMIKEFAKEYAGLELAIARAVEHTGDIVLNVQSGMKKQQYILEISTKGIRIDGSSAELLLNGVQTLCLIISVLF